MSKNVYEITLNQYIDGNISDLNKLGNYVEIGVYDKKSNLIRADGYQLVKVSEKLLSPEVGKCSFINYKTIKQTYTGVITFIGVLQYSQYTYLGPDGGFLVWDRCCRNQGVSNVQNSNAVSTLLYTEFPPLNIINSSPVFDTPAKTVYGCLGIEQNYSFAATDADGDEIRYTLEIP
ncbi:MAG: hypothetical protein EAZ53_17340, partial [Bacteroidetes bacterium]